MTDDRSSDPAQIPGVLRKIGTWLLVVPSVILGICVVELLGHLFLPSTGNSLAIYKYVHEILFFDGPDTIFRNQGDIFTYVPNSEIRDVAGFFSGSDFKIEYDYRFRTNNFGLVQDTDIAPDRESLLLLGDSFTEGQGAEPWFRLVSPEIEKLGYQAINGGLMGTGFEQWLALERYLIAQHVRIGKLVVLFISNDFNRVVRNLTSNDFRCLSSLALCDLARSPFYRLPPENELSSWIAKIRTARAPLTRKFWLKTWAEALLPASLRVYEYLSEGRLNPISMTSPDREEQQSIAAITALTRIYGPANVVFIHLPTQTEVETREPISLGLRARRAILEAGGKVFDGFKLCRLTAADYHANDGHPNRTGYAKIASCTADAIREMMAGAR
jgi:hypothetical protein